MCGGSNLSVGLHAYAIILFSVGRACISMKKVLNSKLVTAWQVAFMGKECFCLVYEDEWPNTNTYQLLMESHLQAHLSVGQLK